MLLPCSLEVFQKSCLMGNKFDMWLGPKDHWLQGHFVDPFPRCSPCRFEILTVQLLDAGKAAENRYLGIPCGLLIRGSLYGTHYGSMFVVYLPVFTYIWLKIYGKCRYLNTCDLQNPFFSV